MALTEEMVMGGIVLWIVFLEYVSRGFLPDFHARKLCHAGCGLGIMMLDSHHLVCRIFVWLVSASSIAMTWNLSPLPAFRFSRPKDIGVTVYLCLVSVWFLQQLPAPILAPVFFADPAGAVIGVQTCQCAMYVLHNNVSFRSRKGGEQAIPEAESSLVPKEDCSRKSSCTSVHLF